jgi:predicted nucleotidyltransferase
MAANYEAVRKEARQYADEVRRVLPVDRAYLYGSYAKGTAEAMSDVDVCFFLRDYGGKERVDMGIQLLNIASGYEAFFEPLVFETSDLERNNPFVKEILHTGIEI